MTWLNLKRKADDTILNDLESILTICDESCCPAHYSAPVVGEGQWQGELVTSVGGNGPSERNSTVLTQGVALPPALLLALSKCIQWPDLGGRE